MTIMDALLLPWEMAQKGTRWLALVLFVVAVIGATAFALFAHKPDMWVRVAFIIGIAEALIWPLCLSTTILLTIDAQQLRLPRLQREAVAAMLINFCLGALVPAWVIGGFSGHVLAASLVIGLMIVAGWLYSMLPRLVSMGLYMTGIVLISGHSMRQLPTRANFPDWAGPLLLVGVAAAVICWRRLVLAANPYRLSWHSPMALRLSRGIGSVAAAARGRAPTVLRPEWLQVRGDLRHCGPGHPVTSLRMAFGGTYMPLTMASRLRRHAVVVTAIAVFVAWFVVGDLRAMRFSQLRVRDALVVLMLCSAAACMMSAVSCLTEIRMRWRSGNAELPLLALLPALGSEVKLSVLRAALWPPLRMLLLATLLVLAVLPRIGTHEDIFALLMVFGTAGFVVAFTLRVAGGCVSAPWEARIVGLLGLLLLIGTLLTGVFSIDVGITQAGTNALYNSLLLGWLIVAVMLLRLGWGGWQALQRRPHPFLV
ncbi:hypothetical protein PY254_16105 [Rhodanobacter sp. AS-Z3]|uniref:hypothetical protein n=1 Tax=Rhodanobacter sp. AS-Z3 TaxID=3031330 RepID=UPI00247B2AD7|nr:hypothetical protein [Rhodanobacter sp. AS-Z3]WEN14736.1 hypothetical protein PY254_16105 [Rhodanobacter sp. AS-Z3]